MKRSVRGKKLKVETANTCSRQRKIRKQSLTNTSLRKLLRKKINLGEKTLHHRKNRIILKSTIAFNRIIMTEESLYQ